MRLLHLAHSLSMHNVLYPRDALHLLCLSPEICHIRYLLEASERPVKYRVLSDWRLAELQFPERIDHIQYRGQLEIKLSEELAVDMSLRSIQVVYLQCNSSTSCWYHSLSPMSLMGTLPSYTTGCYFCFPMVWDSCWCRYRHSGRYRLLRLPQALPERHVTFALCSFSGCPLLSRLVTWCWPLVTVQL